MFVFCQKIVDIVVVTPCGFGQAYLLMSTLVVCTSLGQAQATPTNLERTEVMPVT